MKSIVVAAPNNSSDRDVASLTQQFFGISVAFVIVLLSFFYLIYVGFELTMVKGKEYARMAEDNSTGKIAVFGERGMIVDRKGKPLVENKKTYDVYVTATEADRNELAQLFPGSNTQIESLFKSNFSFPVLLVPNIKKELVIRLKEKSLVGVELRHSYVRHYLAPISFGNVLGYTGIASENDLTERAYLVRNQILGKTGIEYQYDQQLQGETTYQTYEKDAFGNSVSDITQLSPKAGQTLTLTLDKRLQEKMYSTIKLAVDSSKSRGGSAVILDVNTGEVITMATYPTYNPNDFVSGISVAAYKKLTESPQSPLLNRPIAAQEPPGSTFKTIVATAALDTGTISESTTFLAPGVIYLSGGYPFQDYRKRYNGELTIRDALMVSSNIFFCKTAMKLGIDKLLPYAEGYGIGKTTGIDIPGEARGRVPSPENKIWLAKNGATWLEPIWYPEGDTCNSAIGQGIALATPLQMANVAATIANGGTVFRPHVVKSVTDRAGVIKEIAPAVVVSEIANPLTLKIIREGMRLSVSGDRGVVTALRYVPTKVAAKTGTAEFGVKDKNGYSTAHAWVIGFWPYDEPKYAFAMLIEGGGTSSVASFAMRDFLNAIY